MWSPWWLKILWKFDELVDHAKNRRNTDITLDWIKLWSLKTNYTCYVSLIIMNDSLFITQGKLFTHYHDGIFDFFAVFGTFCWGMHKYNLFKNRCLLYLFSFSLVIHFHLMITNMGSCQVHIFNWPISNEHTKSHGIKSEFIPTTDVLLVKIINCLAYDWAV